jgi:type I restriction enzyme M protein
MGYVFEELIRIGAEQSNEEAGEHFTPREVIKLMVNLLLSPEKDLARSHVVKTIYDPACGTGGMLSVAEHYIRKLNTDASPMVYGQDWNDEAWAVCKSDMLIKGEDADNIAQGDTFTKDGFARDRDGKKWTFDYMLANPPFGVEWKQQQKYIEQERDTLGYEGRFGAGLPRINDGALLFLQHMLDKRRAPKDGGSRSASCSMVRPCSPATPVRANRKSAVGSSKTTGLKPSLRCPTNSSTTPAFPPISGSSRTARNASARERFNSSMRGTSGFR